MSGSSSRVGNSKGPKRLALVTLPDGASLTYTYDSTEKLVSITDNLANKIEYINDANGNRIEEKVFDASNTLVRSVANVYDLRNRKTSVNSGGIVTQYGSYRNNLIGRITDGRGNATVQEYDAVGRLTKKTYPSGLEVGYGYDAVGRISQVRLDGEPWLSEIRYQPFGGVTELHWADGRPRHEHTTWAAS